MDKTEETPKEVQEEFKFQARIQRFLIDYELVSFAQQSCENINILVNYTFGEHQH